MRNGRGLVYGFVVALAGLAPTTAAAQTALRLTEAEITTLVTGKSLVVRTNRGIRGTAASPEFFTGTGAGIELTLVCRADGSYRRLCKGIGPTGKCAGPMEGMGTGIWQIQGRILCLRDLVARSSMPMCYEIARAGPRFRFHLASGGLSTGEIRSFLDGLEFEVRP